MISKFIQLTRMAKSLKTKELGKGIRALLSTNEEENSGEDGQKLNKASISNIANVPVEFIQINPFQPRSDFDSIALKELSDSISSHGLIQPITVRKLSSDAYQLISGERRLRASKMAGIKEIPAYIRTANDQEMLEMALVENIQRENLNSIEIALSLQRLIDECSLTHESLSERVNKNRSTVTNYLRLLKLPPDIQAGIKSKTISMGHARALAGIEDTALQLSVYKETITKQLSVREIENLIRKYSTPTVKKQNSNPVLPQAYTDFNKRLSSATGMKVDMKRNPNGSGKIVLSFGSDDDLNRLLDILND